jgi:hypothetical protein
MAAVTRLEASILAYMCVGAAHPVSDLDELCGLGEA